MNTTSLKDHRCNTCEEFRKFTRSTCGRYKYIFEGFSKHVKVVTFCNKWSAVLVVVKEGMDYDVVIEDGSCCTSYIKRYEPGPFQLF